MARALRVVTVQRGVDPRDFALLAFGGAGPLHATQIADELEIKRVLCPRASGVLAALGLVVSPRRRDAQRSVLLGGDALTAERVAAEVAELGEQARGALGDAQAKLKVIYELRYRGQAFELAIEAGTEPSLGELREAFEASHEEVYGYHDDELELELVTIRVSAASPAPEVSLAGHGESEDDGGGEGEGEGREGAPPTGRRSAVIDGRTVELEVLRGAPAPGATVDGPAVVELAESTVLVAPGWTASVAATGTITLERR